MAHKTLLTIRRAESECMNPGFKLKLLTAFSSLVLTPNQSFLLVKYRQLFSLFHLLQTCLLGLYDPSLNNSNY